MSKQNICPLELWAPWYRENHIENEIFTIHAMESEGELLTRQGKINKVIKLMIAAGPILCNDFSTQCQIYKETDIDSDTFSDEEVKYIESEVSKYFVCNNR